MSDPVSTRLSIIQALREELVGPAPAGEAKDFSKPVEFAEMKDSYGPWRQLDSGDEVIQRDRPTQRYGIGVLFPQKTNGEGRLDRAGSAGVGQLGSTDAETTQAYQNDELKQIAFTQGEKIDERLADQYEAPDNEDIDLTASNSYEPSSMGLSILVEMPPGSKLIVRATGGRYEPVEVRTGTRDAKWWLRRSMDLEATFSSEQLCGSDKVHVMSAFPQHPNLGPLKVAIEVVSRPNETSNVLRLVTVSLVNRTEKHSGASEDMACLFQAGFSVRVDSLSGGARIRPYPKPPFVKLDQEEESLELLYRAVPTYAIGHGCAADWKDADPLGIEEVSAESLPVYETANITPDIADESGQPLRVSMQQLADMIADEDGFSGLRAIVDAYEAWIAARTAEVQNLPDRHRDTASRHLADCRRCAARMRSGIDFLGRDTLAMAAFRLANKAMLLQQAQSALKVRHVRFDSEKARIAFSEPYVSPDTGLSASGRGYWRAFQIAFILMSIVSAAEATSQDRDTVELIWFPTGGGKTEAYLGLAAFSMFLRRLRDPYDDGAQVLMRYTLRLLTAQQFQRASRLVCAMEEVRKVEVARLGKTPFGIGLWVGEGTAPNTHADAVSVLSKLQDHEKYAAYKFVLDRCPWCGAEIGVTEESQRREFKEGPRVVGIKRASKGVRLHCPDANCPFHDSLPVSVVDDDIYEHPPTLIIGTVDKFAMLAWKPEARSLFGLDGNGERTCSPPDLIIQDELHLISGPLGSVVGLYEGLIEELCTDRRAERPVRPKIISSTATIRRYAEQVKSLYGRSDVVLFPPPGLESGDSFFARTKRLDDGKLAPGRMYVGVHAPGLGSMQTVQVRTFTALIQAPYVLSEADRDPWWTLLLFFNSLRELGTTLSLLQSDIPDYQQVLVNRMASRKRRFFREIWELTGRTSGEDIPKTIANLGVELGDPAKRPIDICLASSILEVGIDIDRLALMSIVGQPKTTSQYIQVSGRVGRKTDRPGLVVTLYGASKPRDRSHYEKFRTYHAQLYAQVEPTSVTPFSGPSLERALHAVMVAYTRQFGNAEQTGRPYPFPAILMERLFAVLADRAKKVDPDGLSNLEETFKRRVDEWRYRNSAVWEPQRDSALPLMRRAGEYAPPEICDISWSTPQSMRHVDAEAVIAIGLPSGGNSNAQ